VILYWLVTIRRLCSLFPDTRNFMTLIFCICSLSQLYWPIYGHSSDCILTCIISDKLRTWSLNISSLCLIFYFNSLFRIITFVPADYSTLNTPNHMNIIFFLRVLSLSSRFILYNVTTVITNSSPDQHLCAIIRPTTNGCLLTSSSNPVSTDTVKNARIYLTLQSCASWMLLYVFVEYSSQSSLLLQGNSNKT